MSRNLIANGKLSRPHLVEVLVRDRLIQQLEPAPGRSAIFISAPAGYGKSTLLASYVESSERTCLWYRADAGDADPAAFFYYLSMAARRASPQRRPTLPLLTADHLPSLRLYAQTFFSTLFDNLGNSAALLIDDYHELPADSPLHALIAENLARLPATTQVIIASRQGPPQAFARLVANRDLRLLERNEIKLNAQECAELFALHGLNPPSPAQLEQLLVITDGWAAGLTLLIQSGALDRLEQTAAGQASPGMMFDYFANEVLQQLDAETQDFLLKTSLLSQVSAAVSQRLTGNPNASKILAELAARNYFTYLRRDRQDSYEYHALFRGFLLARLRSVYPQDQLEHFYRQAAELECAEQRFDAGVELYARAGEHEALESLICKHAPTMVSQGLFVTLQNWIAKCRAPRREGSPWLQYWSARCALPFDPPAALKHFEAAFKRFQNPEDTRGLLMAWCGMVDTYFYSGDRYAPLDPWIAWLDAWLERGLPFPDETLEGYVACSMANSLFHRQPFRDDVAKWYERAWSIARRCNDPNLLIQTAFSHSYWNMRIGAFEKCKLVLDILRPLIDFEQASPMLKIMLMQQEFIVGWMHGSPKENRAILNRAIELAKSAEIYHQLSMLHAFGAYYPLIIGKAEQAAPHLEGLVAAIRAAPNLMHQCHYLYLRGWEAFVRKDFKAALEYSEAAMATGAEAGFPFFQIMLGSGYALSLFENGQIEGAEKAASTALDDARRMASPLCEYFALFALAWIRFGEGVNERSLSALRTALSFGRRYNLKLCALWWYSEMFEELFSAALEAGIEAEFVKANILARHFIPDHPPSTCKNWPWALKVCTLGGFALFKDDQPLGFGRKSPKKPLDLLKALVALGGSEIAEQTLIDALWPDSDGDTAHSAFSTTLQRLREIVGDHVLGLSEGRVRLDLRRCWLDVRAFEELNQRAQAAERANDAENFLKSAQAALDLYQGPFLAADPDAAWALATRDRLRAQATDLIGSAARWLGARMQWRESIDWYQRGLRIDPVAEEFYQGLMQAYEQLGCRAEAVQAYHQCRQALSRSLGIEPGPATEKLYRQLIGG